MTFPPAAFLAIGLLALLILWQGIGAYRFTRALWTWRATEAVILDIYRDVGGDLRKGNFALVRYWHEGVAYTADSSAGRRKGLEPGHKLPWLVNPRQPKQSGFPASMRRQARSGIIGVVLLSIILSYVIVSLADAAP